MSERDVIEQLKQKDPGELEKVYHWICTGAELTGKEDPLMKAIANLSPNSWISIISAINNSF